MPPIFLFLIQRLYRVVLLGLVGYRANGFSADAVLGVVAKQIHIAVDIILFFLSYSLQQRWVFKG